MSICSLRQSSKSQSNINVEFKVFKGEFGSSD